MFIMLYGYWVQVKCSQEDTILYKCCCLGTGLDSQSYIDLGGRESISFLR